MLHVEYQATFGMLMKFWCNARILGIWPVIHSVGSVRSFKSQRPRYIIHIIS